MIREGALMHRLGSAVLGLGERLFAWWLHPTAGVCPAGAAGGVSSPLDILE